MGDHDDAVNAPPPAPPSPETAPTMCVAGCGFYGSAQTANLCSACHKKTFSAPKPPASAPVVSVAPSVAGKPKPQPKMPPAVQSSLPPPPPPPRSVPARAASGKRPADSDLNASLEDAKPRAKKSPRCFKCRKRTGVHGYVCRCNYMFCSTHRHADEHDCGFDYKTTGREQLSKSNPLVIAKKLEKI